MADDTIKQTKVVEYVQPSPRKWENPKGQDLFFVSVNFADGSEGSVGVIEPKVAEVQDSLRALVGQATEFELKAGKEYNGQQQWKLYEWPGKPSGLGGGGGGSRGGGGMSHSQAGYMAAASVMGPILAAQGGNLPDATIASRVVQVGELITEALFTRQPKTEEKKPEEAPTQQAPSVTLAQLKALKELIEKNGWTMEQACGSLGIKALTDLTEEQAGEALQLWGE